MDGRHAIARGQWAQLPLLLLLLPAWAGDVVIARASGLLLLLLLGCLVPAAAALQLHLPGARCSHSRVA